MTSTMVTKVQMKPGDQVIRLLWWSGDQKNQMTKGVKVTISSNYLVNKPLPEMHLSGSWRKYMHLSRAQSDSCHLFCFLPRLLCVDWPGSVLKASRTPTSSNWSSPGLWTLSYSAATWRRVLCSECGRGKAFGPILLPLWVHTREHTWVHTSPLTSLFILNLFFTWSGHRAKYSSNIIRQSVFLGSLFCFYFLTSVTFQLQMLKCIMANMTDCHGWFHFILLSLLSLYNLASFFKTWQPKYYNYLEFF